MLKNSIILGCLVLVASAPARAGEPLDFNRDVRPILAENCFHCHGRDERKRKADLRLDVRDDALEALAPGKPDDSEVVKRISSDDPNELMPPAKSHRKLGDKQKKLVRQWIDEGAKYDTHWAFKSPMRPAELPVKQKEWLRNPIDAFILSRLERDKLHPSPEATPEAWLRRASLDLIGIPPTLDEIDRFKKALADKGQAAYADAADRLLASPRYGERQAMEWLDIARYADTHGFNNDAARSTWRWRDWVIDSFNENLPYDRFIQQQLAGDLLPNPTLEQRIATGFNRNHVINSEGGIIDEEYRVEYVADRVRTVGMAWLGLSLECCRCHDHKYDPLGQKDYYRLFAFFNNVDEHGEDGRVANAAPIAAAPTRDQQKRVAELDAEIARLKAKLAEQVDAAPFDLEALPSLAPSKPVDPPADAKLVLESMKGDASKLAVGRVRGKLVVEQHPQLGTRLGFDGASCLETNQTKQFQPYKPWTFAAWVRWDGGEAPLVSNMDYLIPIAAYSAGQGAEIRIRESGELEVRMAKRWPAYGIQTVSVTPLAREKWTHVAVTYDGSMIGRGLRVYFDGHEVEARILHDGILTIGGSSTQPLRFGETNSKQPEFFRGHMADVRLFWRTVPQLELRPWIEDRLLRWVIAEESARADRGAWLRETICRRARPAFAELSDKIEKLQGERLELRREFPSVMVMSEMSAVRKTHVLKRGQYDAPGEQVEPGVPETLLGSWPNGAPKNRLGLARWLTDPNQPLTARVVVNRFWQQFFGTGLVKTVEDFGFQAEYPSHLDLLDWLAREFVDGGWNTKAMHRAIVLSATYRQDSSATPVLRERDPENRLLARGPRVRLPAEVIRDQALAVSGLLKERIGGPSVYPYQPEKFYQNIVVDSPLPGTKWETSTGDDLYRRSLYTFWKRTIPHPVMTTLDAPDREVCVARRSRTNTPLQALALMNEPLFLEAARQLGSRMIREGGGDDASKLALGFRLATGRMPNEAESKSLEKTLRCFEKEFADDPEAASKFLHVGPGSNDSKLKETNRAAFAAVASMLLNLDETVTKK